MTPDSSFDALLSRLRQGDREAEALVFERFALRLIGLARAHLGRRLRGKEDPEDVMQSVFKSFFRMHREAALGLHGWDDLWSLLAVIALRKCGHRIAYYLAARRDVRRERAAAQGDEARRDWEALAREPTPQEAAMLDETVEELLRPLEERDRQVVAMTLQGYTRKEIGEELHCTERTVYRVLARLRRQMKRLAGVGD
jgi:RNA polymerase sigma factor (sigma-70 family)